MYTFMYTYIHVNDIYIYIYTYTCIFTSFNLVKVPFKDKDFFVEKATLTELGADSLDIVESVCLGQIS